LWIQSITSIPVTAGVIFIDAVAADWIAVIFCAGISIVASLRRSNAFVVHTGTGHTQAGIGAVGVFITRNATTDGIDELLATFHRIVAGIFAINRARIVVEA